MIERIFALVGLSGVGKSTFVAKLGERSVFQHLSAGSLISQGRNLAHRERDGLREFDIADNQTLLLRGFRQARDQSIPICVLDAHLLIETDAGPQFIDTEVFKSLGVSALFHLSADATTILQRRRGSHCRARPYADLSTLEDLQLQSLRAAQVVARSLEIDIFEIGDGDHGRVEKLMNLRGSP